ncbi:MAG TPA: RNA polymerase sigma-70 factor [Parapedobacter sp.]|uniref:RNA polymerase sigma factor n=1 Tax=Parapedobacter sp. TaxID=1958893 RepID=UPI002CAEC647|nr:RNA polymerase sigma-70 factor [Parapedobacter sp.]HWK57548.1 RNA polymerase sigma-70 factor [Parapedobacter sp.]
MIQTENLIAEETLIGLSAGSRKDFMVVYDVFQKKLFAFAYHYLRDKDLAEDVTQTVFMKIWETRHRINPKLPFVGYLYRITRNEVFNELHTIAKRERAKAGVATASPEPTEQAVDTILQHREYDAVLEEAIQALPPQRQRIFRMCRLDGLTYRDAAAQLGISYYTVKEHMTLATQAIKKHLNRNEVFIVFLAMVYSIT